MAKTKKAGQKSNLKNFYWVLGVLGVVGVAVIAWIVIRGQAAKAAAEPVPVAGAENPQALVEMAKGVAQGNDNAPVKMLVFSDFQCPFCGQFASQIEPLLVSEFVQSGTLQLVYYDFPLGGAHQFSFLASRAARCAGDQGKFWEYHNTVFGRQSDWAVDENMPLGKFLDYGKDIGLDTGKFDKCVKSDQYQDLVSANRMLGERLGVNSTPTLFVNGKRVPTTMIMDIKALREIISSDATGRAPAPAATTTE